MIPRLQLALTLGLGALMAVACGKDDQSGGSTAIGGEAGSSGASSETGGSQTGGVDMGGAGGSEMGGSETGGSETGGSDTGGAGGTEMGGVGGAEMGGTGGDAGATSDTGGAGGATTGGVATGGGAGGPNADAGAGGQIDGPFGGQAGDEVAGAGTASGGAGGIDQGGAAPTMAGAAGDGGEPAAQGAAGAAGSSGQDGAGGVLAGFPNGFTAVYEEASYDDLYEYWVYNADSSDSVPRERLSVQLYPSYGGPSMPGSYSITANDTSFETCGFCVIAGTGCEWWLSSCDKLFMPTAQGTYTIAAMDTTDGGQFGGTLTGLVMQEVVVDWDTYATDPVPDGEVWYLDGMGWSATLE